MIGQTKTDSGSYQQSSSKVLNWQGNPLSAMNPRGYTTYYSYDWRGLNKKVYLDSQVPIYDDATQTYIQKTYTAMNWYDIAGRKIAEVSPKNYVSTMDTISDPFAAPEYACKNFNYYRYDKVGRVVQSGFRGEEYKYNTSTSTWVTSSVNNYTENTYDKNGNVLTSKDEGGFVSEYKYTPGGLLKSKLDPENKLRYLPFTVKYEYDTLGRVVNEKTVKSDTTELAPTPPSLVIDEASALGTEITYIYEPQVVDGVIKANKVTKKVNVTDNEGVLEISIYDFTGNLTSHTECKGGTEYVTTYQYNNMGKVSQILEPYIYHNTQSQIQKIMQYDTLGNLVYTQNKMNTEADTTDDICELYSYNVVNLQIKNQCRQRYNGSEAITVLKDYDLNGNVISETDGNTVQTTYQYDRFDRKTTEQITVGGVLHSTTYDYDLNGNLIRTKDWRDNSYVNFYDSMNRVYKKKDPKTVWFEKLEYNSRSLQVKAYDALNKLTTYDYDTNGRLTCTTDPDTTGTHKTTLSYDNLGNVKEKTDAVGKKLKYTYNILGRLEKVSDGTNDISGYTYYIDGRMKTQSMGTFETTYTYNCFGQLKSVSDPNGVGVSSKTESYEYTPAGLLKEKEDRNGRTTYYSYDCHGRLTEQKVTGSDDSSVIITIPSGTGYDQNGNLKKIIVESKTAGGVLERTVTTERNYDEFNRVKTKKETVVEGVTTTIAGPAVYTYDITTGVMPGEIKEKSEYPGSQTVEKVFDNVGRLKLVTNGGEQTVYEYYNDGRRYRVTSKNKFKQTYTYYDDGLLKDLKSEFKDSSGTYVQSEYYKYYYNANHTMLKKEEQVGEPSAPIKTTSYGYDGLNRLNHIDEPTRIIDYTFDLRGNRDTQIETTKSSGAITYTKYDYTDNNRIEYETKRNNNAQGTVIQKKQYQHDNNGNQLKVLDITTTSTTLENNTYTLLNQLKTSWTSASNVTMTNTFNGEGKRVAKKIGTNAPARYFYEGNDVVFEYVNGTGALSVLNVIGLNLISRTLIGTTNGKAYYFYNGHADVTALIDASTNKMRAQYQYDAFGTITTEKYYDSTGASTIDSTKMIKSQVRYAGYQYDEESKYYNLNARYYDPKIARFLQQDTYMGDPNDPLSLNLYTYCHNDPIMYTDPTGHKEKGTVLKVGSSGEDVIIVQKLMVEYGYLEMPKGVEYGYYGNLTKTAVEKYQTSAHIGIDGKVGDQTWKTLSLYFEGVGDTNAQKGTYEQYNKILQTEPTNGTPIGTIPVIAKGTTSTKVTKTTNTSQTVTKSTSTQVINGYVPPAKAVSNTTNTNGNILTDTILPIAVGGVVGFLKSNSSNITLGIGDTINEAKYGKSTDEMLVNDLFGDNENAATGYYAGKLTGDIVSAIRGASEVFTGGGMMAGGGTISITGFGATVGVPSAVAGGALAAHGIGSAGTALGSLGNDFSNARQHMEASTEGKGGSKGPTSNDYYKKGRPPGGNPRVDKPIRKTKAEIKSDDFKEFLEQNGENPSKWEKIMETWETPEEELYERHYWTDGTKSYYHD